jgi:SNF family Na+-dependent transporter
LSVSKPSRELTIGEIITQTFALYSEKFTQYLIPFLIAGAITGMFTIAVNYAITIPATLPPTATPKEILDWLPGYLSAVIAIAFLTGIIGWIIGYIAEGITIKFASDTLEKGQTNLQESFNFTISRLL